MSFKEELNQWIKNNPLRKVRLEEKLPQTELAVILRRNKDTIVAWERGSKYPNGDSFQVIKEFTGDPDIEQKFKEWYDKRPTYTRKKT